MPNGRCSKHGGLTPTGVASPHFKHGQYSKHLPSRMAASYEQNLQDPELLNIRDDIAITKSRRDDLLTRVDTGESGEAWRSLRATYLEVEKQRAIWDAKHGTTAGAEAKDAFFQAVETIGTLTSEGVADYQAWDAVNDSIDRRGKLVGREMKRQIAMQQMIMPDKAAALMGAIAACIKRHVSDPDTLRAIAADLTRIVAG